MELINLPLELEYHIMEFCLHKHLLPYKWNKNYNNCMHELSECFQVTKVRNSYKLYPDESHYVSYPYREARKRPIFKNYYMEFRNFDIKMVEVTFDFI